MHSKNCSLTEVNLTSTTTLTKPNKAIEMKSLPKLAVLSGALLLSLFGSSCSINMKHDQLTTPASPRSGVVATAASATGVDGKVGWGRFTAFAIPVVPVNVNGDANAQTMAHVHDALKTAGYEIRRGNPGKGKVLTCTVEKMRYNNYTYLFPIVPTWGKVILRTDLTSNGQVVWSQQFKGSGFTFNFTAGYTIANGKAMTKALNEMVIAFSSDEFHSALTR